MKKLLALTMVLLLSASLATTVLAKDNGNNGNNGNKYGNKNKTYDTGNAQINAKHDTGLQKAEKIRKEREARRQAVDEGQKVRMQNINSDNPGENFQY